MSKKDKIIKAQAEENNRLWEENQRLRERGDLKDEFYMQMISDGLRHGSSLAGQQMAYRREYLKELQDNNSESNSSIDNDSLGDNNSNSTETLIAVGIGTIATIAVLVPKAKAFFDVKVKPKAKKMFEKMTDSFFVPEDEDNK